MITIMNGTGICANVFDSLDGLNTMYGFIKCDCGVVHISNKTNGLLCLPTSSLDIYLIVWVDC